MQGSPAVFYCFTITFVPAIINCNIHGLEKLFFCFVLNDNSQNHQASMVTKSNFPTCWKCCYMVHGCSYLRKASSLNYVHRKRVSVFYWADFTARQVLHTFLRPYPSSPAGQNMLGQNICKLSQTYLCMHSEVFDTFEASKGKLFKMLLKS